jgi:hypothetical protein
MSLRSQAHYCDVIILCTDKVNLPRGCSAQILVCISDEISGIMSGCHDDHSCYKVLGAAGRKNTGLPVQSQYHMQTVQSYRLILTRYAHSQKIKQERIVKIILCSWSSFQMIGFEPKRRVGTGKMNEERDRVK